MKPRALSVRRSLPSTNGTLNAGDVPAATAPANLRQGLKMRCWNRGFDWVPDFRQMEEAPSVTGAVSSLSVNAGSAAQKGVELTGYLTVPVTGEYKFYLQTDSNAGSKAFVHLHGMQLIDADYAYTPGGRVRKSRPMRYRPSGLRRGCIPSASVMWATPPALPSPCNGRGRE